MLHPRNSLTYHLEDNVVQHVDDSIHQGVTPFPVDNILINILNKLLSPHIVTKLSQPDYQIIGKGGQASWSNSKIRIQPSTKKRYPKPTR